MLGKTQMYGQPRKSLGQNFLKNEEIAIAEAVHGQGKKVIELGPGYGILTRELCKRAKKVVAVEKDTNLYKLLGIELKSRKLKLINKDFFKASDTELEAGTTDIMISNVPYNLSSKVIDWLLGHSMQAVLCLQKEFVEHMRAQCDSENYSRLSVMSGLCFSMTKIMDVSRGNFYPVPKVDSAIIYIKPRQFRPTAKEREIINLMMQHKNKQIRNALIDSHKYLRMPKSEIAERIENIEGISERAYKLEPQSILEIARKLESALQKE